MRKGNQPTDLTVFANALREVLGLDKLCQKPSKLKTKPAEEKAGAKTQAQ